MVCARQTFPRPPEYKFQQCPIENETGTRISIPPTTNANKWQTQKALSIVEFPEPIDQHISVSTRSNPFTCSYRCQLIKHISLPELISIVIFNLPSIFHITVEELHAYTRSLGPLMLLTWTPTPYRSSGPFMLVVTTMTAKPISAT